MPKSKVNKKVSYKKRKIVADHVLESELQLREMKEEDKQYQFLKFPVNQNTPRFNN